MHYWRITDTSQPILKTFRCYRFGMKTFSANKEKAYHRENHAFQNIGPQPGLIGYIGSFDWGDSENRTHNIILEYADFDLFTAIRKEAPPILHREIKGFWCAMGEVAQTLHAIHSFHLEGHEYHV